MANRATSRPGGQETLDHPANLRQGQPRSFFYSGESRGQETRTPPCSWSHGGANRGSPDLRSGRDRVRPLLLIVLFHLPPDLGEADQAPETGLRGKRGKPELRRLLLLVGPFHEKPLSGRRRPILPIAMGGVDANRSKPGDQMSLAPFSPANRFPPPHGQGLTIADHGDGLRRRRFPCLSRTSLLCLRGQIKDDCLALNLYHIGKSAIE